MRRQTEVSFQIWLTDILAELSAFEIYCLMPKKIVALLL